MYKGQINRESSREYLQRLNYGRKEISIVERQPIEWRGQSERVGGILYLTDYTPSGNGRRDRQGTLSYR